jgi:Cu/Zn superoxide dismutase
MKLTRTLATAALAAALAAPAFAQTGSMGNAMSSAAPAMPGAMGGMKNAVKVTLNAQNNSGETGAAFLIPDGDKTKVTIVLKGAPADAQPVHIHKGPCAKLDPKPAYPLTTLMNGKSVSTVDVPLSKLTDGTYSINAHKSTTDIGTYVSCGDIPKAGAM